MVAAEVRPERRTGAYWRDLVFGSVLPALFFSLFVADQVLQLSQTVQSARAVTDYLFVLRQVLALSYFTMLVVLYSTRLPQRGTDHRLGVILVAFTGTFSALLGTFLPGGERREWLVLPGDILATIGLIYSVWGLAYLRRSFSITPEARRLVTGGPYRLSRPPVYLRGTATAIAAPRATPGWPGARALAHFVGAAPMRAR